MDNSSALRSLPRSAFRSSRYT